jgi:phytoene synthase
VLALAALMARPTSFYYSFLVLPSDQRRAIVAVWDFCRAIDDAVDEPGAAAGVPAGSAAVPFWRAEVARCYNGERPATAQGIQLQPFIKRFNLPRQRFEDVIDGVAMDVERTRYQTFEDLLVYCRRVAAAVGLICLRIFGSCGPAASEYALNLGIALQLTNILRDVRGDLERGRIYLPLNDLAACGVTVDDLSAGAANCAVRGLIEFECGRAREFYRRAAAALPRADRRRLLAPEIMRAVYLETLTRIEQNGYDVFTVRARVPRARQALIALRQWLWAA